MNRFFILFLLFFSSYSFAQSYKYTPYMTGRNVGSDFNKCLPPPLTMPVSQFTDSARLSYSQQAQSCIRQAALDQFAYHKTRGWANDSHAACYKLFDMVSSNGYIMRPDQRGCSKTNLSPYPTIKYSAVESTKTCSSSNTYQGLKLENGACYNNCVVNTTDKFNYTESSTSCFESNEKENFCKAYPNHWSCLTCDHGGAPREGVGCDYTPPPTGDGAGTPSGGFDGKDCSGCDSGKNTCTIDGLKYDAGNKLGYHYCDRPPLKTCPDNTIILKTASCNADSASCNSKASCCDLAIKGLACDTSSNHVTCDYKASSNGDYTATAACVAGAAPANSNTPTYATVDNSDVIKSITDLQSNQSTLLDFVAKSNRQVAQEQTTKLTESIKQNADRVIAGSSSDSASVVSAINSSSASIKSSIDSLKNSKSTLPTPAKEASKQPAYITTLKNSDFGRMFNNFKNITFPTATCQPITIDLSSTPIGKNVTSNAFCEVSAKAETPLKAIMYIFYLIIAFRVIGSS